jgi:predicted regulator of Ras-like GTPase activity (Roadblock/LC7/MglB family)
MNFARLLQPVAECPGVITALITDRDGIAVEVVGGSAAEGEELAAEFSSLVREVTSANRELQLGRLEQVVVTGDRRAVFVTAISDDYFLMTLVESSGNQGKARFRSRIAAHRLRSEFM